jgi:hypothetical protein
MKMSDKIYRFLFPFVLLSAAAPLSGQLIEGEIRTRIEQREGFKKPLADTLNGSTIAALRTRIKLQYADEKVKAKISLQDSRIYGQTGINDTGNSLGIYEAWGTYVFTPALSVTIGRQPIEYDDKRLFTASNWSNTGNAHDLVLLAYDSPALFKLHFGAAWNNMSDTDSNRYIPSAEAIKPLAFCGLQKN